MNVTRPNGTTHVDPNSKIVPWYRLNKEGWSWWSEHLNIWRESTYLESWYEKNLLRIVDRPQQDLTTLDVPFGELDRDTQLRLINHVLDGGKYKLIDKQGITADVTGNYGDLVFLVNRKYRAVAKQVKQPTERETLEAKLHEQWVELNATMKRITEIK